MKALLLATAAAILAGPALTDAARADAADYAVSPWTVNFDNLTVTAGGLAYGALFATDTPPGPGQRWATGAADLRLSLQRDYDSGLQLALKTSFEVARDRLSYDNYGGNLVQHVYGQAQTGLGSVEIGMTDGAGYVLAVTGPVVDDIVSLDNPNETYFIDPSTGRAFQEAFGLSTSVNASSNYAKISYYTPRLFGVQLGVSYTPGENREVIPFLNNGPHAPNRQKSIWETAFSYSGQFEDFSLGFYGSAAFAHGDGKTPDAAGLTEWSVGTEVDVPVGEEWKLAFGGSYHHTNNFGLDIYSSTTTAGTETAHASAMVSWNAWSLGAEYGRGTADAGAGGLKLGQKDYQIALGYQVNANIQATIGWQELNYDRNLGAWYNCSKAIRLDAGFLHVKFKV